MITVLRRIDGQSVAGALQEAREKLDAAEGEVVLDFSSVRRIASAELKALEQLADLASAKGIKIALRNVNVDLYKVLKLVKLAPHFSFLA
jgi:anti-anti-sigma regulatory factor